MALRNVFAFFSLLALPAIAAVATEPNGSEMQHQWQLLSANNFTDQIHLHPHILLLVTVPWCGESRFLMREISLMLEKEQQKYSSLKLMFVYRNVDNVLADFLGIKDEITFLQYHHAVSYRYQGSLRVSDILSSAHHLVSLVPEELPLKRIKDSDDMESFLASTDKAVMLLETCGWASELLAQHNVNETKQGGFLLRDLGDGSQASGRKKYLKDLGNCEVEDECGRSPWVGEFSAENGTASLANEDPASGISCSLEEFKKFESFFSKFIAAARDAYLPPRRQRYAFLSDKSLLSPLGVEVSDLWSLIISHSGCPGCLIKVKEETHLQDAFTLYDLPVMELLEDGKGLGPYLPSDKPSILLFVDRTSASAETKDSSKEALVVLKELALQQWKLHQKDGRSSDWPRKSTHTNKGSGGTYRGSRLVLSSASHKIKDKMSVVIIKDGKQVTLDSESTGFQSSSLHKILTDLLAQKKHSKLSSLANEAGFQLLSDDIEIKIKDEIPSLIGSQTKDSIEKLDEVSGTGDINVDKGDAERVLPPVDKDELSQSADVDAPLVGGNQKASTTSASEHPGLTDPHQSFKAPEVVSSAHVDSRIMASVEVDESEDQGYHRNGFTGSFFFCDGNYKFLSSLTDDLKIPSIVIIDPMSQQHHVLPREATINLSSVSTFIDQYLNGSLLPYHRSGPLRKSIGMPHPPFVNLDFQEKDPIPSLTTETLSELVVGSGQFDAQNVTNAWQKDMIVLFSSSWCGFCQRMELVVREAYRALKGYMNMVNCGLESKGLCSIGDSKDDVLKVPTIYSIDCTLNDCGWILKSSGQMEVYPTLLLFSAEKKVVIPFTGSMIVTDIIKFLVNHGIISENLTKQKGTLWMEGDESDNHDDISRNAFSKGFPEEINNGGAFSKSMKLQNQVTPKPNEKATSEDLVAGSLLIATERLDGLNPFSGARILIVAANPIIGFQGLIVNKPISWDHVLGSEDAEQLRKAPISFGGPVIQEGMPLVSLTRSLNHQYPQVMPGVYLLDQSATIQIIQDIKAGLQSATEYWFFWGYSGWNWDQLYNEITEGAWKLLEGSIEDLQWP